MLEIRLGFRQADDIIEIIHGELGGASLQSLTIAGGHTIGHLSETEDDLTGIVKSLQTLTDTVVSEDGILALAIEIGSGIGGEDTLGTDHQLRGKLLVFMENAWCKAQLAQNGRAEDITTGRTMEVVLTHVVGTSNRVIALNGDRYYSVARQMEQYKVGVLVSDNVETLLIGNL